MDDKYQACVSCSAKRSARAIDPETARAAHSAANVPSVAIKSHCSHHCSHHLAEHARVPHVSLATTGSMLSFLTDGLTLCPQAQNSLTRSFSKTGTLRVLEFSVLKLCLPTFTVPSPPHSLFVARHRIVNPSHNT
jgi:hypothetical protein